MIPGTYSVIRYIADPGRNEALNVGILAWRNGKYQVHINQEAVDRVVSDNPFLAREALAGIEPSLLRELDTAKLRSDESIQTFLTQQKGFPLSFSEPRFTTLSDETPIAFEETLERLIDRVVRPKRRYSGGGVSPVEQLTRLLRPLIASHVVKTEHPFESTKTGRTRTVSFFRNSSTNVALDVARLGVKKSDDILFRADAEAFKSEDILERNGIRMVVYCHFLDDAKLASTQKEARRVIESAGAKTVTSLEEAAKLVGVGTPK